MQLAIPVRLDVCAPNTVPVFDHFHQYYSTDSPACHDARIDSKNSLIRGGLEFTHSSENE